MNDAIEVAVEAGAKAFHEAARRMAAHDNTRTLSWEASSDLYRAEIRNLVRPAVEAAIVVERERCATLAQAKAIEQCTARDGDPFIGNAVGQSISAAIREEEQADTGGPMRSMPSAGDANPGSEPLRIGKAEYN